MLATVLRISGLAMMIFLAGWLGSNIILPPAYASPLWPPAGLSLAVLLIWGKNLWPAVFLGAFANNLLVGIEATDAFNTSLLISSALIACASTLQASVAMLLSRKWLGSGVPLLNRAKPILLFFLLTGPIACLIAPTMGVSILLAFGIIPSSLVASSWFNWWIGDSLGVLIVCPLVFCLLAQPRTLWSTRLLRVALPLSISLLVLTSVFMLVYNAEKIRIQLEFDNQAKAIDQLIVDSAMQAIDSSLSLRDFFVTASPVNRNQFAEFSQSLLARHSEIQVFEWLPRVSYAELPAFEQAIQSQGFPAFKVMQIDSLGNLVPAKKREEYFPITFIQPMQGNERIFGLDSLSNSSSKQSKDRARITHQPSVSQKLALTQSQHQASAVVLSIPVFAQSPTESITGFISAVILPAVLVDVSLNGHDLKPFALRILDLNAPADQANLFSQSIADELTADTGLTPWKHEFLFCDRTWQLTIAASSHFLNQHTSLLPWLTLLGGLSFTSLLSFFLLTLSGRTAAVENLVNARTLELQQANAELKTTEQTLRESKTHLRTILDSEPECVQLIDHNGSILDMNPAGLAMLDADNLQQIQSAFIGQLILPKYQSAFEKLLRQVFAGESGRLQFEVMGLKGHHRWLDIHAAPMRDSLGNIMALLGVTRDITYQKQAEDQQKLAARVFGEAHEGILITDADGNIIDVNPTFSKITGYSKQDVIGKNPRILQSNQHNPMFYRDMWQTLIREKHWRGEVWNRKKDGELYAELLTLSALCDEEGQVINFIGLFSDITHLKHQQEMLEQLAHYDPLTQLPNRTLFADRLTQAIARSKRDKSLLAICFLDLDGFKPVNDQFGHEAGDSVLVEVAERLKYCLREEDTVSRHGGDEFALLLGELHSIEECCETLMRIHHAIAESFVIHQQDIHIGVSSGMTIYPLDDVDPDTLIRHADHAMYQAKLAGKNRYHLFDANQDQLVIDHHKQLSDIESAFTLMQFVLHYQPKVNIKTGQVIGVEALIRWMHPQRGLILPQEFLPVIASDELEIRIGDWVLDQALRQLSIWRKQGLTIEISVNISAYHLLSPGFIAHLESALASNPLVASHFLQLEILESTALDDLSAVNRIIKNCRDVLGVTTALDDFGTGYSSLAHLRHLPVNAVKIDKGFVRDMLDDPDDYAIVESVISLSQAFRHQVIAEGVETLEQGLVLMLMGCSIAQGFGIAKPMLASEVASWIADYQPFPDWQAFANKSLTTLQTQVTIRRIYLNQWLQRVHQCLNSNQNSMAYWPIMLPNKSHFGRWLGQAQQQNRYNSQWMIKITALHAELLLKGNALMHQFWEGESQSARNGFAELEQIHRRLDACLAEYA